MTTYPRVDVVGGPSAEAPVYTSLNEGAVRLMKNIGSDRPPFELGVANTDRETRAMRFGLRVTSATRDDALRIFAEVSRSVDAPNRWLAVQFDWRHQATYFKLMQSAGGVLDFDRVWLDSGGDGPVSVWAWDLELEAVGPGYAERVTLPPFTLANADLGYVIPEEILGDAESLATITVKPGTAGQIWHTWENLLSVIAVDPSCPLGAPGAADEVVHAPVPAVIQWEAEAFTLAGGATTTASGTFSGGTGVLVDEQNTAWRTVLSGSCPVTPPPGRYAVHIRCSRSTNTGQMRFRFGPLGFNLALNNDAPLYAPTAGAADAAWLYVGDVSFPSGQPYEGLTDADMVNPSIQLSAKGLAAGAAGTNIAVDRIALVPIELAQGGEARTMRAKWGASGPFGPGPLWNSWRIDGEHRRNGLVAYDGRWYGTSAPPIPQGGFPLLRPGMRNIVTLLHKRHNASGGGVGVETLAGTAEITISYSPRVRHLASS